MSLVGKLLPRKTLTPEYFFLYRTRCMVAKMLELRGYEVDEIDRYMWEDDFLECFGRSPPRSSLNFGVCKKKDETYTLVVLFAEDSPTAKTIREYGEYMRLYAFRWAVVVLVYCEPTRQARKAVASLLPRYFIEFVRAEEVSDWVQDRPGLIDYGPRWPGDEGVRVEAARKREAERAAAALKADPELDALMPKLSKEVEEEEAKRPKVRVARKVRDVHPNTNEKK